jgi:tRNA uridine 5-carbamoylmethylation protein Kti12
MTKSISWLKQAIAKADRPTITFLIGVPGSGKSTWLMENLADLPVTVISTDDILEHWAFKNDMTYSEAWSKSPLAEIEGQMYRELLAAVTTNQHVIVDRTNMSEKARAKILARVPGEYLRFAVIFTLDRFSLDRRLELRMQRTGKFIPPDVIDGMLARYEAPTTTIFDEIFI